MPRLPAPHHPLHLIGGMALCLAWFVLVYASMSIGCAAWPGAGAGGSFHWINAVLLVVTALTIAVQAWAARCSWKAADDLPIEEAARGRARFIAQTAAFLYLGSALATLFVGIPLLVVPPCV